MNCSEKTGEAKRSFTSFVSPAFHLKYQVPYDTLHRFVITAAGYILSAVFLSLALKKLPLGTAYAMWTGFGIIGTTILGIVLFHEGLSTAQMICVLLIAAGIARLKLLA